MNKQTVKIGIAYHEAFARHDTGPWHPESKERLEAILEAIVNTGIDFEKIEPREASKGELALVHSGEYIDRILGLNPNEIVMLDPDTAFSPGSKDAALRAAGSVQESVDMIMEGTISRAFCPVRPPGHHAEPDRAMGFCIFNNIAIGAAYAVEKNGIEKAAIIDWDVHHGNGTQKMFYDSDKILYISLHQYPHYPGTGAERETGEGKGNGYNINIPMLPGAGDNEYREAFKNKIMPALSDIKPELILVSAGFDAHRNDPLAGINLSSEFYGEMTAMLRETANGFCGGRMISVLEGGYNLDILKESVAVHLTELSK